MSNDASPSLPSIREQIEQILRQGHYHKGVTGTEKLQEAAIPEGQLKYYAEPFLALFEQEANKQYKQGLKDGETKRISPRVILRHKANHQSKDTK